MWLKTGDLGCQTCGAVLEYPGPRRVVLNAARAHGWHCFQGRDLSGREVETHLCPQCVGTNRSSIKSADRLNEDVPLF